jgi:tetratricopeptide (TPR) repeat protein
MEVLPSISNGSLGASQSARFDEILECTTGPGDMVYVPQDWYHSTLAVGHVIGYVPACRDAYHTPLLISALLRFPIKRMCGVGPQNKLMDDHERGELAQFAAALPNHFHALLCVAMFAVADVEAAVAAAAETRSPWVRPGEHPSMLEVGFVRRARDDGLRETLDSAIDAANKALASNPMYAEVHAILTAAHTMRGDLAPAESSASKALELDPQDFTTCRRLAKLLMSMRPPRLGEARDISGACVQRLTAKLAETSSRECALALFTELEHLSTANRIAAVAAATVAHNQSATLIEKKGIRLEIQTQLS